MMVKCRSQRLVTKVLKAPKDRMVSASTKPCDSFVADPQSDKRGMIEIESKSGFGPRRIFLDQATVDADHFQGPLFEVMRFLRVQSQDLPRNLAFGDDESRDGLSSKAAHRSEERRVGKEGG